MKGQREPSCRLLLVEDHCLLRRAMARWLEQRCVVRAVGDAAGALALCSAGSFDVALVDYSLPDMDGVELLRRVRVIDPRVARILTSGCRESEMAPLLRAGVLDHFVPKPVDPDELWMLVIGAWVAVKEKRRPRLYLV